MSKAIADLKPKPPATTDKKTAFWNGYMTLANEYDKEFLQKYGTDLDTSLIFAGLFSAVASAFIIQIQPEFESAPHPLTVIAQSLLYISLGSTLLASLLAVLGKQWLMYYSAAGEQGTIERRGLERQRKLDGLIKWRFELIMQAFPLCLQFGLFLFAAALSVYLWRIHQVLAGIVIGITAGGAIAYFALLATAIFFKDSPFQTPLVPFLRTMVFSIIFKLRHIKQLFSPSFHQSEDFLPRFAFTLDSDPSAGPAPLFKKPIPSPENSGVSWVLEYSTDLTLLAQAADMSVDVQWPVNMDLTLKVHVLRQMFLGCFEYHMINDCYVLDRLRSGMDARATQFGRAYITMQCFREAQNLVPAELFSFIFVLIPENYISTELDTIFSFSHEYGASHASHLTGIPSQPWLLRTFHLQCKSIQFRNTITYLKYLVAKLDSNTSLTCSSFSEYLFVVYFCLVDANITTNDTRVVDKSAYEVLLYEKILKSLLSKLESEQIDMQLIADILKLTLQLARNCKDHREWEKQYLERQKLGYEFCQALPQTDGWTQVICTPGLLSSKMQWYSPSSHPDAESWIYRALGTIPSPINEQGESEGEIINAHNSLLCALYNNKIPPSKDNLELLIKLLSLPGHVSLHSVWLMLQENVHDWYTDLDFGAKLRSHSMLGLLSAAIIHHWTSVCHYEGVKRYIDLAYLLSPLPEWQPHIQQEICCWIIMFQFINSEQRYLEKYIAVFKAIWAPSQSTFGHNHCVLDKSGPSEYRSFR
ncbi:hypothetical protein R3P38DRAFT_3471940 [Favolaschia claudopus]|uniref:DUF6535 domain-containing protein n=1 Tax=Favolaschia claudopus TaxID=2862362 RepID=A0AAV9ZCT8_9AGAR